MRNLIHPFSHLKFCAGQSQSFRNSIVLKENNIFLAVVVFWDLLGFFIPDRRAAGSANCTVQLHQFSLYGINSPSSALLPQNPDKCSDSLTWGEKNPQKLLLFLKFGLLIPTESKQCKHFSVFDCRRPTKVREALDPPHCSSGFPVHSIIFTASHHQFMLKSILLK